MDIQGRLLIGKGRDGLIFRLGTENLNRLRPQARRTGEAWGGWVIKVPRFQLPELPQYYQRAVASSLNSPSAFVHARESMIANFHQEVDIQKALWKYLIQSNYLNKAGFPSDVTDSWAWEPNKKEWPKKIRIQMELIEDDTKNRLNSTVLSENCQWMPEGIMDGFSALMYHFTPCLLLQFLRDILHQLKYLEEMGVVHGDFKLSNILLFVCDNEHYVFVLADFWDAFTIDNEGAVLEMRSTKDQMMYRINNRVMTEARPDFRRLLRWKFTTEKFGTRLYKDPHILNTLRLTKKRKEQFTTIKGFNAGAINNWSFGVVMGSLLSSVKDKNRIKNTIKEEILFSGKTTPGRNRLTEKQAVTEFRQLFSKILTPKDKKVKKRKGPEKSPQPYELLGKSSLINQLRAVILKYCLVEHAKRGSVQDIINMLDLKSRTPSMVSRDIKKDLHECGRCSTCIWMRRQKRAL